MHSVSTRLGQARLRSTTRAGDAYDRLSDDLLATDATDSAAHGDRASEGNWLGDMGGKLDSPLYGMFAIFGRIRDMPRGGDPIEQRLGSTPDEAAGRARPGAGFGRGDYRLQERRGRAP